MSGIIRTFFLLPILLLILFNPARAQGYRIGLELEGLSGDTVILGEYFTSRMTPKDTIVVGPGGNGVFSGEEALTGGMYLIYLGPDKYFDFLLGDDQDLLIRADTSDISGSLEFRGSEDNRLFLEYKDFLGKQRQLLGMTQAKLKDAENAKDTASIREEINAVNRDMEAYMDRIEKDYPEHFVSTFIGATREPVPPENLLTGQPRHDDSLRFFYFMDHYLDRFDPFDVRLLHTPVYEGKIKGYITRAVPQHPDSLKVAADFLLEGSKKDPELYRYMLITLFNHFAESKYMGMDAVYFHIAEYYYIPDATWSSPDFIAKLRENLDKNKGTLIGEQAPDLLLRQIPADHFHMAQHDTIIRSDPHIGDDFFIHDIKAAYTILYFWEVDCGHCEKATPALYEVYERLKDRDVAVISVHVINTIEGKEKWVDFVNEKGLYEWINCWSPYSNDFRRAYNLQSYPQLFVFDRDKKILAKRVTPQQAEQIINNLIAQDAKN